MLYSISLRPRKLDTQFNAQFNTQLKSRLGRLSTRLSILTMLATSTLAFSALSLGMALPSFARPATLYAADANSRINVRSAPTLTAQTPHYGVVGDRVEILRTVLQNDAQGDTYAWQYIRFRSSGAEGWVRGDFVNMNDDSGRYAYLGSRLPMGDRGDRINVRSAPSAQSQSLHYGLAGDVVKILDERVGRDKYTWQYVQFPSGAKGWVRGDLVQVMEEGC